MNELELITVNHDARQLLAAWNDTTTDVPEAGRTLTRLLAEQAARTPDAPALVFEGESLTYRELHRRADGLANLLVERGVGPGVLTGVCADRSLELVIALLGVLKAGGAYVPLDPDYPADRLAYMVADSAAPVVLTQTRYRTLFDAETICLDDVDFSAQPIERPQETSTKDLAYVIYTSGSTGRPKGVLSAPRHRQPPAVDAGGVPASTADDRVLQKTPSSFDVSVWEFFWPLLTGARWSSPVPAATATRLTWPSSIRAERITTVALRPVDAAGVPARARRRDLRRPAPASCAAARRCPPSCRPGSSPALPGVELHNLYGPTEAAVDVTVWRVAGPRRRLSRIGRPVGNTRMYVLDAELQPVAARRRRRAVPRRDPAGPRLPRPARR